MATVKALARNGAGFKQILATDRIVGHAGVGRTPIADVAYTALTSDVVVAFTSLTAARTVTLPAANAFTPGQVLVVMDETGLCSSNRLITVAAAGTDKIMGQSTQTIGSPYGAVRLVSNGTNLWTVL